MKITLNITRKVILALVAVSVIGSAAAALSLFSHTFPVVTVTSPNAVTTCSTITLSSSNIVSGSSGTLQGTCVGNAAFTIAAVAGGAVIIPSFTLPTGYTTLAVVPHGQSCQLTVSPPEIPMASGTGFAPGVAGGSFDYCLHFSSVTTDLATFFVTWTQ